MPSLRQIICPECRLELHFDGAKWEEWQHMPQVCPQCGRSLAGVPVLAQGAPGSLEPEGYPMAESTFRDMAHEFQALESLTDNELGLMLENAGHPPPANRFEAVMRNMRRVYGDAGVTRWLKRCCELGILT